MLIHNISVLYYANSNTSGKLQGRLRVPTVANKIPVLMEIIQFSSIQNGDTPVVIVVLEVEKRGRYLSELQGLCYKWWAVLQRYQENPLPSVKSHADRGLPISNCSP
jgi:hypothetical protein